MGIHLEVSVSVGRIGMVPAEPCSPTIINVAPCPISKTSRKKPSDDVKALFLEYTAAGVPFYQSLKTEPWGARTFIVCDPDGNLIMFAG